MSRFRALPFRRETLCLLTSGALALLATTAAAQLTGSHGAASAHSPAQRVLRPNDCNANGVPDEEEATTAVERAYLRPPTPTNIYHYAADLACRGSRLVVGDFGKRLAHVYERSAVDGTWTLDATLNPSDDSASSSFGNAVALGPDFVAVSARGDRCVYVYVHDGLTWVQQAKLSPPSSTPGFGVNVAAANDRIAVTAFGSGVDTVYVFDRDALGVWSQTAALSAGEPIGQSIALDASGSRIATGYTGSDLAALDAGAVHVFDRDASGVWTETAVLVASDPLPHGWFGSSVALDGDRLAISAQTGPPQKDLTYVFDRDANGSWIESARLVATPAATSQTFASNHLALEGDRIVSGADATAYPFPSVGGQAFVFDRDVSGTWKQSFRIRPHNPDSAVRFGTSVAIDGATVVVGADASGQQSDAAYVYDVPVIDRDCNANGIPDSCDADCNGNDVPDDCDLANGTSADCDRNARPDECDLAIAGADCDGNGEVDACEIAAPLEHAQAVAASGGSAGDAFGAALDADSDRVVAGAPLDDVSTLVDAGSARVLRRDPAGAWIENVVLTANDASAGARFGSSVGIWSNRIVVGAPFDDASGLTDSGSAYVFVRSGGTWVQETKLVASDAAAQRQFGRAVSIDGPRIVIGASSNVYTFEFAGGSWAQTAQLTSAFSPSFGSAVAVRGNRMVIGRPGSTSSMQGGFASVFELQGTSWVNIGGFGSDNATLLGDHFGAAVAIDGDLVLVGAYDYDTGFGDWRPGAAFVYERYSYGAESWWVQTMVTFGSGSLAECGWSVALDGARVAVGSRASTSDDLAGLASAADRAALGRWTSAGVLTSLAAGVHERFGSAVAISGNAVIVGADRNDVGSQVDAGSLYVFTSNDDVDQDGDVDSCE